MKNMGLAIGLFALACGGATVLATSITRSVMAPKQQQAADKIVKLESKIVALEREIESLKEARHATVRENDSLALWENPSENFADAPTPRVAAPAAEALPAPTDGAAAPMPRPQTVEGESAVRDIVARVLQEREEDRAKQREEQQRQREVRRLDQLAQQLDLQEQQKGIFRQVMLEHEQKVRDAGRTAFSTGGGMDETTRQAFTAELARLRQERDLKLTPYLLPTQIQKLGELEGNRGVRTSTNRGQR